VIHPADTVAIALAALAPGPARVRRAEDVITVTVREPIPMGHKLALADIAAGSLIVKYGEAIGEATAPIAAGAHVHVHNLRSRRAGARAGSADT
jgi:altronate dehydratase